MSKERLETGFVIETAKREVVIAKGVNNTRDYVNLPIDLVLVLIEQAERVQELENILEQDHRQEVLEGLYEQNKRYREVLEEVRQNMIGHYGVGGERDTYVRWSKELIDRTLEGEE